MITLCMDTSFHFLTLVIIQDSKVIASIQEEAYRQQSETILTRLDTLFKSNGILATQINEIVITDGPGSYTGLRIAMSIAKTLAAIAPIKLYTLSSLKLLAGKGDSVGVLIDARANRVYFAHYDHGKAVIEDGIHTLEEAESYCKDCSIVYGHLSLLKKQDVWPDYSDHFLMLRNEWREVTDVLNLSPRYFKDHEAYQK
jgi:tRNA threonylcarbamoyladenosine biosynthesis protein TsaB